MKKLIKNNNILILLTKKEYDEFSYSLNIKDLGFLEFHIKEEDLKNKNVEHGFVADNFDVIIENLPKAVYKETSKVEETSYMCLHCHKTEEEFRKHPFGSPKLGVNIIHNTISSIKECLKSYYYLIKIEKDI